MIISFDELFRFFDPPGIVERKNDIIASRISISARISIESKGRGFKKRLREKKESFIENDFSILLL